jgi:hypothetical protein
MSILLVLRTEVSLLLLVLRGLSGMSRRSVRRIHGGDWGTMRRVGTTKRLVRWMMGSLAVLMAIRQRGIVVGLRMSIVAGLRMSIVAGLRMSTVALGDDLRVTLSVRRVRRSLDTR